MKKKVDEARKTNWKSFSAGCLSSAIFTCFVALIGVNFIYFTSLRPEIQDRFFPSNMSDYFTKGGYKPPLNDATVSNLVNNWCQLSKVGIPPNVGWPYGTEELSKDMAIGNWFAVSIASVYSYMRWIIKEFLGVFAPGSGILSSDLFQILFINIFHMSAILLFPFIGIPLQFIWIFLMTVLICITTWRHFNILLLFPVAIFPAIAFWLSVGISYILPIQAILTFFVLPFFVDNPNVSVINILKRNTYMFTTLFFVLCALSAVISKLNPEIIVGLVVAIVIALTKHLNSGVKIPSLKFTSSCE